MFTSAAASGLRKSVNATVLRAMSTKRTSTLEQRRKSTMSSFSGTVDVQAVKKSLGLDGFVSEDQRDFDRAEDHMHRRTLVFKDPNLEASYMAEWRGLAPARLRVATAIFLASNIFSGMAAVKGFDLEVRRHGVQLQHLTMACKDAFGSTLSPCSCTLLI